MATKLTGYKCTNCGRVTTYHRLRCLSCANERFETIALPEDATLVTFTEVHMLPFGFDQRFLRFGVAEFSNGARATGWVTFENAKSGMPVKVRRETIRDDHGDKTFGFTFHPAG